VLATDKVRFVGDPVAFVVAESADIAHDAALLIRVEYRDLPCVVAADRALAAGAPHGLTWTLGLIGCAALVGCMVGLVGVTLLRRPALALAPPVPTTSIYSRSDGIVAFAAETLGVIATSVLLPRRLGRVALWASINWLGDAAALGVLLTAFGHPLPIPSLLFAYGLAAILNAVPLTPGGVGIVEGVLVPVLVGLGVPGSRAVLGVTAWRLVQFWMPIPLAAAAAATLLRRRSR